MATVLSNFWSDEEGQDMVEYTVLIAIVALSTLTYLEIQGTAVSSVWGTASTTTTLAAQVAR